MIYSCIIICVFWGKSMPSFHEISESIIHRGKSGKPGSWALWSWSLVELGVTWMEIFLFGKNPIGFWARFLGAKMMWVCFFPENFLGIHPNTAWNTNWYKIFRWKRIIFVWPVKRMWCGQRIPIFRSRERQHAFDLPFVSSFADGHFIDTEPSYQPQRWRLWPHCHWSHHVLLLISPCECQKDQDGTLPEFNMQQENGILE